MTRESNLQQTVEWPPRVWHGVIDPETGDPIPPVKLSAEALEQ